MFNRTHGWLWQFESDIEVHGVAFAARKAREKGVPLSMTREALRIIQGGAK